MLRLPLKVVHENRVKMKLKVIEDSPPTKDVPEMVVEFETGVPIHSVCSVSLRRNDHRCPEEQPHLLLEGPGLRAELKMDRHELVHLARWLLEQIDPTVEQKILASLKTIGSRLPEAPQ